VSIKPIVLNTATFLAGTVAGYVGGKVLKKKRRS
jgi:hypothetical protein